MSITVQGQKMHCKYCTNQSEKALTFFFFIVTCHSAINALLFGCEYSRKSLQAELDCESVQTETPVNKE